MERQEWLKKQGQDGEKHKDKVEELFEQPKFTRREKGDSSVGVGKQVKEGRILCNAMVPIKKVGPAVNTRDSSLNVVENAQTQIMKGLLLEDESSEEMSVRGNLTCAERSARKEDFTSFDSMEDHSKVVDEVLEGEDGHISIMQEVYLIGGDDLNVQCVANEQ
ncbi:Hypothetical predicted protein [Olea europaea subsp. europaea]|uniref:Uncharacterized protein n=1 Tax=Olea europaea subsp. europaea TaxID=158383 RepID=A0A8S0T5C6_OLEEU|nr:Hypothetical predicted protein [Olea europaea subsp. europaea]